MTEEGAGYRSRCCAKVRPPARMCFPVDLFHNSHIFPKRRWMMTTDFVLELFEFIVMFDLFFFYYIFYIKLREEADSVRLLLIRPANHLL